MIQTQSKNKMIKIRFLHYGNKTHIIAEYLGLFVPSTNVFLSLTVYMYVVCTCAYSTKISIQQNNTHTQSNTK